MAVSADITVVIPAFQAASYVSAAITSVLDQDLLPCEVIVVDDGSTDSTGELVGSFGAPVTLITQPNRGEAAARNTGLRAASSEWVAFLDADDRFLPGRIRAVQDRVTGALEHDVLTTNGFLEHDGDLIGRCYGPLWTFAYVDQRAEILRRNFVFGHVVARRQQLLDLGGYDESIRHTADWAMWIRLILRGGTVGLIDEELSIYRVHPGSLSADRAAMARGGLASLATAPAEPGVTPAERAVLRASMDGQRRLVGREAVIEELGRGSAASVRGSARVVVVDRGQPAGVRLRGLLAFAAPRLGSAMLRRRRRRWVIGTTGRRVPRGRRATSSAAPTGPGTSGPPLVSVILPFLNEERYLQGAIATVADQTTSSWELLLVDDGSSDASASIADEAATADPARVRVLRHPDGGNAGLAASRNLGLAEARAGAIAFLDADDRWEADKLTRQLRLLADHPMVAMVGGPTWHLTIDGHRVARPVSTKAPRVFGRGAFAREIVRDRLSMPPPPSAVMYRTRSLEGVGGVPKGDSLYEDQRTFVAVNRAEPVLITDDEPLSTYLRRPDSLFGALEHAPAVKAAQKRTFEWWVIGHCLPRGATGWGIVVALVTHRLGSAIRRRIARR